ncbi:MAG: hypothetical protein JO099_20325, partial [Acidobacteriia bacterium]|nr:hypothetical protein [Terriglobia bacterium]
MIHPVVRDLFLDLAKHPACQDALRRLVAPAAPGALVSLSGLTTTAKALYSVLLGHHSGRSLLVITDGNKQAEALWEAVETFFALLGADER